MEGLLPQDRKALDSVCPRQVYKAGPLDRPELSPALTTPLGGPFAHSTVCVAMAMLKRSVQHSCPCSGTWTMSGSG